MSLQFCSMQKPKGQIQEELWALNILAFRNSFIYCEMLKQILCNPQERMLDSEKEKNYRVLLIVVVGRRLERAGYWYSEGLFLWGWSITVKIRVRERERHQFEGGSVSEENDGGNNCVSVLYLKNFNFSFKIKNHRCLHGDVGLLLIASGPSKLKSLLVIFYKTTWKFIRYFPSQLCQIPQWILWQPKDNFGGQRRWLWYKDRDSVYYMLQVQC